MGQPMSTYFQFLSGAAMFGAWAGGVFFLRFWTRTRDRLFLIFGLAFWIIALERLVMMFVGDPGREDHSMVYLIRLVAFVLILWAIIDKNRADRRSS